MRVAAPEAGTNFRNRPALAASSWRATRLSRSSPATRMIPSPTVAGLLEGHGHRPETTEIDLTQDLLLRGAPRPDVLDVGCAQYLLVTCGPSLAYAGLFLTNSITVTSGGARNRMGGPTFPTAAHVKMGVPRS